MTAFVTASEPASFTASICGATIPAALAKSATAARSTGTDAGTAGSDRRSGALTADAATSSPHIPRSLAGQPRTRTRCTGKYPHSRREIATSAVAGDEPAQHDGRLRARDLRVRADALDRRLEMSDVGGAHVDERVGLAADGVRRDDLGLDGE